MMSSDSLEQTIRPDWCKDCMRDYSTCKLTYEECVSTPPVTKDEIYNAMVKAMEIYNSSDGSVKK